MSRRSTFEASALRDQVHLSGVEQGASPESESVSYAEAGLLFGDEYFGPEELSVLLGTTIEAGSIPFTREELQRAKKDGMQLVYYASHLVSRDGKRLPITINNLPRRFKGTASGARLYDVISRAGIAKYKDVPQQAGWKLVSKYTLSESRHQNYLEQTDLLVTELRRTFGTAMPRIYQEAIDEFGAQRAKIASAMEPYSDERKAGKMLANLRLTKLFRETPTEAVYRRILNDQLRKPLEEDGYAWTSFWQPIGNHFVYIGSFTDGSVGFDDTNARNRRTPIGFNFSRGPVPGS